MIILVGGMERSGSTFSFNIVREIMQEAGSVTTIPSDSLIECLSMPSNSDHLIVKSHDPDQLFTGLILKSAIYCVCTYRKPADAIASRIRAFGGSLDAAIIRIKRWMDWHISIYNNVLSISFEKIEHDRMQCIIDIQKYLGMVMSESIVDRLAEKYEKSRIKSEYENLEESDLTASTGTSIYSRETFFHRRHVTSLNPNAAEEEFTGDKIDIIKCRLRPYLDKEGYYKPSINWVAVFPFQEERIICNLAEKSPAGILISSGVSGCHVFGPYIELRRGTYKAVLMFEPKTIVGSPYLDVCYNAGQNFIQIVDSNMRQLLSDGEASIVFCISESVPDLEIRIHSQGDFSATYLGLKIIRWN